MQVPQPAALFHNDCQHLARELLTLPYQYAPALTQLAPSASAHCIEAAQRLRAAGAAVLDAQVTWAFLNDMSQGVGASPSGPGVMVQVRD
jgi:hypothetical protein